MNMVFSLVYAPLVFLSLRHFNIHYASLSIFTLAALWFLWSLRKIDLSILFPVFYMIIAFFAYTSESFLVLKIMPLLLSMFFSLFLLISYIQKRSLILYFAKKFSPHDISKEEENYIHSSTLFWFFVTVLNTAINLWAYLSDNIDFWLYYSSIGWYFLFILAGLAQYLHRKYVFLKVHNA